MSLEIIKINGRNPFDFIRIDENHITYPTFKLTPTFNECCSSDKDFLIFEDTETKERHYYLIKFIEVKEE